MTFETATLPMVASLFLGSALFLLGYLLLSVQRAEPEPIRVRVTDPAPRDLPGHDGPGSRGYDC